MVAYLYVVELLTIDIATVPPGQLEARIASAGIISARDLN